MSLIIGISGKIGSGKDYLAKEILVPKLLLTNSNLKPLYLAFADPLKAECSSRHGTTYELLYQKKDTDTRTNLQKIGDELREKYGEEYFTRWMRLQIKLHENRSQINLFVITDVRFPEEIEMIHELGGKVYRVHAPERTKSKLIAECPDPVSREQVQSHRSEILLDECDEFDGYIMNDPNDHPEDNIDSLIRVIRSQTSKSVLDIDRIFLS